MAIDDRYDNQAIKEFLQHVINCNGLQAPSQVNSISRFAQKDVCIDGLFCIDDDHHHHGPGQERDDPPMCFQVLKP